MMRLFVATAVQPTQELRRLHTKINQDPDVRPAPLDHLHITYQFLGETPDAALASIIEALDSTQWRPAFDVGIRGAGVFRSQRDPRVFWAGLHDPEGGLTALHDTVRQALEPAGHRPDRRNFRPHLTLARRKGHRKCRHALEAVASARQQDLGSVPIDRIELIESRLSPQGPEYESRWRQDL